MMVGGGGLPRKQGSRPLALCCGRLPTGEPAGSPHSSALVNGN